MSFSIEPIGAVGRTIGARIDSEGASLEQRMLGELARLSESASQRQDALADAVGADSTDPMKLVRVQGELAKFHIEMSLNSALARKAVAVVETLVKG